MQDESRCSHLLVALGVAVALACRALPWLLQPQLALDDGAFFFAQNYSEFQWGAIFRPYAGYVPVGTNLSALLLCRLPIAWIPVAFVLAAMVMMFGCARTLLRPAWEQVAPYRIRVAMAYGLVVIPFGSNLEFTSLAYAQWPQMLWLFLLLMEPLRATGRRRRHELGRCGLVVFLAIANPLSVLLAPLGLLPMARSMGRLDWRWFLAAVAGYWLMTLALLDGLVTQASTALPSLLEQLLFAVGVKVVLEGCVGVSGAAALYEQSPVVHLSAAVLLSGLMATVIWMSWSKLTRSARVFACACFWLLLSTLAASLVARPDWMDSSRYAVRYAWLGRAVMWLVLLCALGVRWRAPVALLVLGVFAFGLANGNWRMHYHPGNQDEIHGLVEDLNRQEERWGGRGQVEVRVRRRSGMSIVIPPR